MAAKKKVAVKAKTKTKAKVRLNRGKAGAKKSAKLDPAKMAQRLIKRAEVVEKHAARFAKVAVKHREKAARLAAKTLAKPKCHYSPKMQAALEEIAKLGQEVEVAQDEAMQVVADVLKGDFR